MTLVVEDGTGLTNADAYISIADADAYHASRGNTSWAGQDAAKEIAIRKATDYIEGKYNGKFRGYRYTSAQALSWPRSDAYDNDGYSLRNYGSPPKQLIRACAEYALIALTGNLFIEPDPPSAGQSSIKSKREKVGPIEEETTYDTSTSAANANPYFLVSYPAADILMAPLLNSTAARTLVRG